MVRIAPLALSAVLVLPLALPSEAQAVYHPRLGRFLQRDPIGYEDGMGLYEYVTSQPTVSRDPEGLQYFPNETAGDHPDYKAYGYAWEALWVDILQAVFWESDLPPERSPEDFVWSRDYCCECVPVARKEKAFSEDHGRRYANAKGTTRSEIDADVHKHSPPTKVFGRVTPVGAHVEYPSGKPCPDLVYQARSEHERTHVRDMEALQSEAYQQKRSFTDTWNSSQFQRQTEVKAYGVQARFYQGFIDACVRKFPEARF